MPPISTTPTLRTVIDLIIYYLNIVLVLMMAVAVVLFVYYVIKYYIVANANRAEGGQYVLYSVIGFFVILSFWGIVNILQNSFGLGNNRFQPGSWSSFTNLFPRGSSGTSGTFQGPTSNPNNGTSGTFRGPAPSNDSGTFRAPTQLENRFQPTLQPAPAP